MERQRRPLSWHLRSDLAFGYDTNVYKIDNHYTKSSPALKLWGELEREIRQTANHRAAIRLGASYDDFTRVASERYSTVYLSYFNHWPIGEGGLDVLPQLSFEQLQNFAD